MSQITVENIKRSTETASRSTRGVAAAWVNFNGTGTVAVRDSENVSSLTDDATGLYSIGLSNNMGNSNYSLSVASRQNTNAADIYVRYDPAPSVSSFTVEYVLPGTSRYDVDFIYATAHGDLA